jgi:thioredoxin-like negative regulator of GroEL
MGEAESLAREAAALFAATDYLNSHADVLVMLAEVLAAVGKDDEARETLAQAHDLYERKGNLVRRDQVRELLAELADPSEAH